MSRRRFLGWEPRRTTTYTYDDAGRVTSATTTVEAEWDDTERAWAIALLDLEADQCTNCGHSLSETTQREAFDGYDATDPAVCQGCKALLIKQKDYVEAEYLAAYRFGVFRTWTPQPGEHPHGH